MPSFLRRWLTARPAAPKTARPRFRPAVQALDDRITPALAFATHQTLALVATDLTTGDINSDGRPDLVTTNYSTNMLSVRLNTTAAGATSMTFGGAVGYSMGTNVQRVALGDFNGDGRPDAAVTSADTDAVAVRLNTTAAGGTTTTWGALSTFSMGNYPRGLTTADFNGDGRADIVAANEGEDTVSVRLNTTTVGATSATFAAVQTFTVGNGPWGVAVADINGDGRSDLLTANEIGNTVSVRLNTTTVGATSATFATALSVAVNDGPWNVTVGDFDGDGRPDFATANRESDTVSLRRNTTAVGATTASFAGGQTFAVGDGPYHVVAADLDGDGRTDFASANTYTNTVTVRRNTTAVGATSFTFASAQTFTIGLGPNAIAAADFNGDGRPDLATPNTTDDNVSVLRNTSTDVLTTGPVMTGQFGTSGIWAYNRSLGIWTQLTAANASQLATAANGTVLANFAGNGVWYYRPTGGWVQLSTIQSSALALDKFGTPYVSFDGYGTYSYQLFSNSWVLLPGAGSIGANKLLVSENGDVVVNYASHGLYRFRRSVGWAQLDTKSAVALAVGDNGDIAASFNGFGTYLVRGTGSTQINGVVASQLAVGASGVVVANFVGYGVSKYTRFSNGWTVLTTNSAATSLTVDLFGNVFAAFNGAGVYEYNQFFGWRQRTSSVASLMGVGR